MINSGQLKGLGFSENEANIYFTLLELGPATITEITRSAGLNRTTGYAVLNSLSSKGFVSPIEETKIQKFVAESPEKVVTWLEAEAKENQAKFDRAQSILPELLSVYNTKEKPKVKFYEGIDKMREAFEDTLTAKDELLAYAVGTDMFKAISRDYFKEYSRKKVERKIKVRVIAPDDAESRAVVANDKAELRESRLIPQEMFYFSIETNIYNNKILTISWKEKFAVMIESEEIANAQRKIFELAWIGAKHIQK